MLSRTCGWLLAMEISPLQSDSMFLLTVNLLTSVGESGLLLGLSSINTW